MYLYLIKALYWHLATAADSAADKGRKDSE